MSRPGADELTELLWDNGPALRTTPSQHFPPAPFFQPFTCSAAGSSRAHELDKQRHAASSLVGAIMDDDDGVGLGLGGVPVHHYQEDEEDDAVPWLHCPGIDDGDSDTAPLPPEYCESLLSSGYSGLHAVPEPPADTPTAPCTAPPPPSNVVVPATQPQPSVAGCSGGESIMNFSFFSRPLQRPQPSPTAAASRSNPLESTSVVQQTMASRLRSTPLFSEQRMSWFQPPTKAPRDGAVASPAAATQAPTATDHRRRPHAEAAAAATVTVTQQRVGTDKRAPDAPAAVTTSSVCSANGERSQSQSHQAKRGGEQHAAECSVSQDEDVDDEPGAARRSAARGTKRSRTAEVHNLSERRRRDRINEKMRALQELIPNCNKVDKASMLEEAIEYLKTLQLQVQMMSMGAGLCMTPPPAMLMQMMQVPPFAAAYPHHLGMQMHMSMFDMLPRFAGAPQFPCPMVPAGAPPAMAMPHGSAMFGMPGGLVMPQPFAHVNGGGAAPAEPREGVSAVAVAAPGEGAAGAGERPPVAVAPQGDQQKLEHPKQT